MCVHMHSNTAMSFEFTSITYLPDDELIITTFLNLVLGYINRLSFMHTYRYQCGLI